MIQHWYQIKHALSLKCTSTIVDNSYKNQKLPFSFIISLDTIIKVKPDFSNLTLSFEVTERKVYPLECKKLLSRAMSIKCEKISHSWHDTRHYHERVVMFCSLCTQLNKNLYNCNEIITNKYIAYEYIYRTSLHLKVTLVSICILQFIICNTS